MSSNHLRIHSQKELIDKLTKKKSENYITYVLKETSISNIQISISDLESEYAFDLTNLWTLRIVKSTEFKLALGMGTENLH